LKRLASGSLIHCWTSQQWHPADRSSIAWGQPKSRQQVRTALHPCPAYGLEKLDNEGVIATLRNLSSSHYPRGELSWQMIPRIPLRENHRHRLHRNLGTEPIQLVSVEEKSDGEKKAAKKTAKKKGSKKKQRGTSSTGKRRK
jgi:hypothetical protein